MKFHGGGTVRYFICPEGSIRHNSLNNHSVLHPELSCSVPLVPVHIGGQIVGQNQWRNAKRETIATRAPYVRPS